MSTSEFRSVDAESDLPISSTELAALASQLFAARIRPGPDSPPQAAPLSPRGNAPDTTVAGWVATAAGATNPVTPAAPYLPLTDVYVPAPTSPEPEGIPQTVPVAPRGNVPDATAAPSAAYTVESTLDPYAVPTSGLVPTVPGVGRVDADGSVAPAVPYRSGCQGADDRGPRLVGYPNGGAGR